MCGVKVELGKEMLAPLHTFPFEQGDESATGKLPRWRNTRHPEKGGHQVDGGDQLGTPFTPLPVFSTRHNQRDP